MARKSRKNIPEVVSSATVQTEMSRPFRAGLYARISMETEETLERGTIETQVELMKNFVADTEDISVAEVYKDSDYSGTNFDRPGFVQMMEDIKHGKINCVIVKDLSRLGRNYVETSNYVDDDVLRLIQTHMKTVLDIEKMIQEMNTASKNQTQYLLLDKEVGKLRRELSRISKRKSDLYEDYSERLITEEEYIQFSRIYSNEIENIKSRLDTVLAAQVRYSQDYHIEEGWGNVIHTYMSKRKLTKEMADAFVDSIIIHGKYDYEIKLVYDDQFADLQKLKKEKEAQSR